MTLTSDIEKIDFDGAKIESIERIQDTIVVNFSNCLFFDSHPYSSKHKGKINNLQITFYCVKNENSVKYIGVGIYEPYNENKPMEFIELLSVNDNYFEFGGYVGGEPWFQWSFNANHYVYNFKNS